VKLAALMIDGVHFREHVILVALGIDESGAKHVLGLWEGATENATACTALLANLRERGLATHRSLLVVIDGSKALARAVRHVFGRKALLQRCQVHKRRNVLEHLPESAQDSVEEAMKQAYASHDADRAQRQLENLARRLEGEHPSAAASLREGLEETLTIIRLGLPETLTRSLSTTNAIENLLGTVRRVSRRVTRWRGGSMILRWVGAGVREAAQGFRRLKGKAALPKLVALLRARDLEVPLELEERAA
jgi:transposase-like protein